MVQREEMNTVNGLRVYIMAEANRSLAANVFFSQRGKGPLYRWRYEDTLGRWQVMRLSTADLTPNQLSAASWKSVPQKLQAQLGEHYLE
jgi:hypothetical protein